MKSGQVPAALTSLPLIISAAGHHQTGQSFQITPDFPLTQHHGGEERKWTPSECPLVLAI